jgi:hypothetical protein
MPLSTSRSRSARRASAAATACARNLPLAKTVVRSWLNGESQPFLLRALRHRPGRWSARIMIMVESSPSRRRCFRPDGLTTNLQSADDQPSSQGLAHSSVDASRQELAMHPPEQCEFASFAQLRHADMSSGLWPPATDHRRREFGALDPSVRICRPFDLRRTTLPKRDSFRERGSPQSHGVL